MASGKRSSIPQSVYLDSTVPSYHCDTRPELASYAETTRLWWKEESGNYDVFTSEYTLAELGRGEYPGKEEALGLVRDVPVLASDSEVERIAEVYMKEYVMPTGAAGDAFHLACASYHKMDYLLTWNCNHLANANKDHHIRVTNSRLGLFTPRIVTPIQLFRERF